MTKKFKIGDKVKVVRHVSDSDAVLGKTGVVGDLGALPHIGVMFPGWNLGHDLNGLGENRGRRDGWFVEPAALRIVRAPKKVAKKKR